ncbi:MAG: hydrogenase maturation nickel metallochaperone HypA [Gammaproteobacteria bacterium]|nr:hydrogenase maturation nickel metallochaperone HypA [Gammaproteobacteria bacterium]
MHEISLCEGILQIIESEADKQGFSKVRTVCLEIGDLSCVSEDALHFGFEAVMRHSIAEGAKLEIINIPATAWCMQCSKDVKVKRRFDECPDCGSYQLQATGGDEMKIQSMEVD